jgi:hypothetical protein
MEGNQVREPINRVRDQGAANGRGGDQPSQV